MHIKEDIIAFVSQAAKIPKEELNGDVELYSSAVISSLKLLDLMTHIEKAYCIILQPEEFIEENFKTIGVLARFIESKLPSRNE